MSDYLELQMQALCAYIGWNMFKSADANGYYTYEIEGLIICVKPTGDYNYELKFNDGAATENTLEFTGDTISETLRYWLNNNNCDMNEVWSDTDNDNGV